MASSDMHARCGVTAIITDGHGRLLLIRSRKPGRGWELPGGKINSGELWRAALTREVREETGLDLVICQDPPRVLDGIPADGATWTSVIILARGHAFGEPVAGDDAKEARWFRADEIAALSLSEFASTKEIRYWVYSHSDTAALAAALDAPTMSKTTAALERLGKAP